jgi:phosphoglycerol transferase MdoB-like AlkP superfamily enzyme
MVATFYSLVLAAIFQQGTIKNTLGNIKDSFVMSLLVFAYTCIPLLLLATVSSSSSHNDYYLILSLNFIFSICIASLFYLLRFVGHAFARLFSLLAMNVILIINILYVSILYETGFDFGPSVVLHASKEILGLVINEYGLLILSTVFIIISISFLFYKQWLAKREFKPGMLTTSLSLLAITANVMIIDKADYYTAKEVIPSLSLYDTIAVYNSNDYKNSIDYFSSVNYLDSEKEILQRHGITKNWEAKPATPPSKKQNVIIIYLESLQYELTKRGGWPEKPIVPVIDGLTDRFTTFNNFYNSTTPTVNAMISSQCGIDIEYEGYSIFSDGYNSDKTTNDHKTKTASYYKHRLSCMPDILKANGYTQVFMKGADIDFTNKRRFFEEHGYDEVLGRDELFDETKHQAALNSWGLSDIDLFNEALTKLDELEKKQPFNLTVLTVNSHVPGFEDHRCPKYSDGNTLTNGFHCSDYALGNFLEAIFKRKLIENTYVFLVGDHTLFAAPSVIEAMEGKIPISWYGKTYFSIFSPNGELPKEMNVIGYTPDFAATVLDLLNFEGVRFINGKSLITERKKYPHLVTPNYEIKDGAIVQNEARDRWNSCTKEDISMTRITSNHEKYSVCERAKIYAAQMKLLYFGHL